MTYAVLIPPIAGAVKKINTRKKIYQCSQRKHREDPKQGYTQFFEEWILLENSKHSQEEYFFMDKENFLRNLLITQPVFCGSMAIIKPNGQAIIRNGEYSTQAMPDHLRSENWDLFFPPAK